jgi:HK97 family phage portal protein
MNPLTYIVNLLKRDRPSSDRVFMSSKQAGVYVDEDKALTHSAVWSSVRVISETIAALPWRVHQRQGNGNTVLENSDLDYTLHIQPNPEQSAFSWRETILAHALLWGNGYAEIERNNRGEAWNLWQIAPDKLHSDRTADGRLWYFKDGEPVLEADNVFHLHGLGFDGLTGYSVIRQAAKSMGISLALDAMAAATFANGGQPGVVFKQKDGGRTLTAEGVKNLLESFDRRFSGPANGGKSMYLDGSIDIDTITLPFSDLQFLESRKFQVSEIARWFRVPPHKLADLERATFSNIEHQSLEFVTDTLVPWITRLETEAQIKLIGRNNRQNRLYTKINVGGLLRGDIKSRYDAYGVGRTNGWLSANDIRSLEDMNPVAGGDEYIVQLNMVPVDMLREINKPQPVPVAPIPAPKPAARKKA